jgi:hypothetical protein
MLNGNPVIFPAMLPFFAVAFGIYLLSDILIFLTEITAILFGYHVYTDEGRDVAIVLKNRIQLEDCWLEHVPKLRHLRYITTPFAAMLMIGPLYAIVNGLLV